MDINSHQLQPLWFQKLLGCMWLYIVVWCSVWFAAFSTAFYRVSVAFTQAFLSRCEFCATRWRVRADPGSLGYEAYSGCNYIQPLKTNSWWFEITLKASPFWMEAHDPFTMYTKGLEHVTWSCFMALNHAFTQARLAQRQLCQRVSSQSTGAVMLRNLCA